jgi:hypothetical protein
LHYTIIKKELVHILLFFFKKMWIYAVMVYRYGGQSDGWSLAATGRQGRERAGPGRALGRIEREGQPSQPNSLYPSPLSPLSLSPSSCPRACLLAAAAGVARRRGRGAREAGRPARRPLILLEIEQEELAA